MAPPSCQTDTRTPIKTGFDLLPLEIIEKIAFSIGASKPIPQAGLWTRKAGGHDWERKPTWKTSLTSWQNARGFLILTAGFDDDIASLYMHRFFQSDSRLLRQRPIGLAVNWRKGRRGDSKRFLLKAAGTSSCSGCSLTTAAICEFTNRLRCSRCKDNDMRGRTFPLEVAHSFFSAADLAKYFDTGVHNGNLHYRMKDSVSSCPETVLPVWEAPNVAPEDLQSLDDVFQLFAGSVANSNIFNVKVSETVLRLADSNFELSILAEMWFSSIRPLAEIVFGVTCFGCFGTAMSTGEEIVKCNWFQCRMCVTCHYITCGAPYPKEEAAEKYGLLTSRIQRVPRHEMVCKKQIEAFAQIAYGAPPEIVPNIVQRLRNQRANQTSNRSETKDWVSWARNFTH